MHILDIKREPFHSARLESGCREWWQKISKLLFFFYFGAKITCHSGLRDITDGPWLNIYIYKGTEINIYDYWQLFFDNELNCQTISIVSIFLNHYTYLWYHTKTPSPIFLLFNNLKFHRPTPPLEQNSVRRSFLLSPKHPKIPMMDIIWNSHIPTRINI